MAITPPFYNEFSEIVRAAFSGLSFEISDLDNFKSHRNDMVFKPDLIMKKGRITILCEVKFYRSRKVPIATLRTAANAIANFPSDENNCRAIIVSSIIPDSIKEEILKTYNVVLWDRSNLAKFLIAANREDKAEELGTLIMEAQQGLDTRLPYEGVNENTEQDPLEYFKMEMFVSEDLSSYEVKSKGISLIASLLAVPDGTTGWADFEDISAEILEYLFNNDLSVWKRQQRTDDELSRFDMICRVNSQDDFWRALVSSFNSRYVLFEFKNYKDPIPQGQIYTTERYLFPKALRGTAIIIARNGAHANAISAAKGALREHGKLIMILDQSDLIEMIRNKDNGDIPSDYLSDKLDEHLMSVSR